MYDQHEKHLTTTSMELDQNIMQLYHQDLKQLRQETRKSLDTISDIVEAAKKDSYAIYEGLLQETKERLKKREEEYQEDHLEMTKAEEPGDIEKKTCELSGIPTTSL